MVTTTFELQYWNEGITYVAGVDEAGRGPLAGPVVASAVMFDSRVRIQGIDDSKKLTAQKREALFPEIYEKAISVGIGIVTPVEIDEINILQATFKAMNLAISTLTPQPQHLLIDGNRFKDNGISFQTIIKGDGKSISIAAASVIAKVTRDRLMYEFDKEYPQYGFAKHKGYGTRQHVEAIRQFGLSEIHRKSFHLKSLQTILFEKYE